MKTESNDHWLNTREIGSTTGIRLLLILANCFGRKALHLILHFIVFYYAIFNSRARLASANYLKKMQMPHAFWNCYRHLLHFAQCTADRLFFIQGRTDLFEFKVTGNELLDNLYNRKQGGILLGAHLGSFEAMVAKGPSEGMIVNVVGYFSNARMINKILEKQGAGSHTRMIDIKPNDINFMLQLHECIKRGELIAILGDRNINGQTVEVDFLGNKASFPVGVYMLAAVLRCPIYLTFGLYYPPNRYELHCELLADHVTLPRKNKTEAAKAYAQQFADRLGHYCRLAPNNWFNYYDFWNTSE